MRRIFTLLALCSICSLLAAQTVDVTSRSQNAALQDTARPVFNPDQVRLASYPSISETYQIPSYELYDQYWDVNHLRSRILDIPFVNDRLMLILIQAGNNPFVLPCVFDDITLSYGPDKKGVFHTGVDLKVEPQTLVKSCFDGVVRMARPYGDYGLLVTIRHYNGIETVYAHLDKLCVKPGQIVNAGDVIGQTGNSGNVKDYTLHFETRFMNECFDPQAIIDFDNETLSHNTLVLSPSDFNITPLDDTGASTAIPAKPQTTTPATQATSTPPKQPAATQEETYETPSLQRAFDGEEEYHIVQKGETLYRIASKYQTTTQAILKLNNIQNADHIVEGQRLRVR